MQPGSGSAALGEATGIAGKPCDSAKPLDRSSGTSTGATESVPASKGASMADSSFRAGGDALAGSALTTESTDSGGSNGLGAASSHEDSALMAGNTAGGSSGGAIGEGAASSGLAEDGRGGSGEEAAISGTVAGGSVGSGGGGALSSAKGSSKGSTYAAGGVPAVGSSSHSAVEGAAATSRAGELVRTGDAAVGELDSDGGGRSSAERARSKGGIAAGEQVHSIGSRGDAADGGGREGAGGGAQGTGPELVPGEPRVVGRHLDHLSRSDVAFVSVASHAISSSLITRYVNLS